MATRWSGSRPCFRPRTKTSAARPRTSVIDGSFLDKQAVPLLHPLVLLIEHRGRVDQRVVELVHMRANLGAHRHAAHGLEQLLSLGREHEIYECDRRLRIGRVARDADALWTRHY